jgi:hypothetical protein
MAAEHVLAWHGQQCMGLVGPLWLHVRVFGSVFTLEFTAQISRKWWVFKVCMLENP